MPILLPGVGTQGGSLTDVLKIFKQNKSSHFLINVSRGIIYKSPLDDFADEARRELKRMNDTAYSIMKAE